LKLKETQTALDEQLKKLDEAKKLQEELANKNQIAQEEITKAKT